MVGNGQLRPARGQSGRRARVSFPVIGTATFPPCGRRARPRYRRHQARGGARRARGRDPDRGTTRARTGPTPKRCSAGVSTLLDESRSVAERRRAPRGRVRRRLRWAHDARWRAVSPLNIPQWRSFPLRRRARRAHRARRRSSTTTRRRSRSARVGSAPRAGEAQLHRHGGVDRRRRRHRRRRPFARRRDRQRRPHRPCHRRARRSAVWMRRPGVPRSRSIRAVDQGAHRQPPEARRAETIERPARSSAARWARSCRLLDLRLAVVAGSVALGFGEPFFAAAQPELDAAGRGSSSPRALASCPAGSATTGRSSAPPSARLARQ